MIALDREKPKTCLGCPCLWTLSNITSEDSDKTYMARYCAASFKEICVYEEVDPPLIDAEWTKFSIPVWCPWQEV